MRAYFTKLEESTQQTVLTSEEQAFLTVKQLFDLAGEEWSDDSEFVRLGTVLLVSVTYDCDLNNPSKECQAEVSCCVCFALR